MFFKKKAPLPRLRLYGKNHQELYNGLLKDLPLKEEVIIQSSIRFFNDPEPCHIHRNAVSLRLTEEILHELSDPSACNHLITKYSIFPELEEFSLILSENQEINGKTDK